MPIDNDGLVKMGCQMSGWGINSESKLFPPKVVIY